MIFVLLTALIIWCVFLSHSPAIGSFLYRLNNAVELKLAGLRIQHMSHVGKNNSETFSYLESKKQRVTGQNESNYNTIIMLHGFSADKLIWLKFAKYFTHQNVLIPDFMAHGDIAYDKSTKYSAYEQAKYIARFICAKQVTGNITLIGNSMGGMVAAILAEKAHQDQDYDIGDATIADVVLLDPAGAKTEFATTMHAQGYNPFVHESPRDVYSFYDMAMHRPPFMPPSVKAFIAQTNYIAKREQYAHMFADFFNPSEFFSEPLANIQANVRVIWGEQDALLPVSDADSWSSIVGIKANIMRDTGHMPMVERPKQTVSLINYP